MSIEIQTQTWGNPLSALTEATPKGADAFAALVQTRDAASSSPVEGDEAASDFTKGAKTQPRSKRPSGGKKGGLVLPRGSRNMGRPSPRIGIGSR
jgi:hypothetical protein